MSRATKKIIYLIEDKKTIIVCEKCERVCDIGDSVCPVCESELIFYIRSDEEDRQDIRGVFSSKDSNEQGSGEDKFQGDSEVY